MAYKVLRGVHLTSDLLNEWEGKGYQLVEVEEHMGMYDVVFSNDSGGGGESSLKNAEKIDSTLKIVDKTLGVKFNNAGNIIMEKTSDGVKSTLYWNEFKQK